MGAQLEVQGMVVVEEHASAPPDRVPPLRGLRRWPVAAVLAVVLIVASAAWWEFDPNTLRATGNEAGVHGQIGRAAYFDAAISANDGASQTVDLRSVRPVIVLNTAAASVGVLLCHTGPDGDGIGAVYELTSFCTSVNAFHPGAINLKDRKVQIILVVTPNARGTVRIAGVDVSYRDGIRRGHQRTGINTVVNVP